MKRTGVAAPRFRIERTLVPMPGWVVVEVRRGKVAKWFRTLHDAETWVLEQRDEWRRD